MGEKMTLEKAAEFMRLVDNGQISGRISEWVGLREACGVIHRHLTQPAQAVDVGAIRDLALRFKYDENEVVRGCGDRLTELLDNPRSLSAEKAGWRDIATAPKDGTRIMLTNGHGVWMADYQPVYPSGYRPSNPWSSVLLNHEHMPLVGRHKAPTHWMPLPTPPTDGEE
jgi:hypothetical protein